MWVFPFGHNIEPLSRHARNTSQGRIVVNAKGESHTHIIILILSIL